MKKEKFPISFRSEFMNFFDLRFLKKAKNKQIILISREPN